MDLERKNVSDDRNYVETLSDALALKLGHAIWNFARIELMAYEYIKILASDDILSLVGDQSFASRIGILKKLAVKSEVEAQLVETATKLLDKAMQLAGRRNTIAHNPWQIYIDFEKHDFVSEIWKHTNPTSRLSESDISQFSRDAAETADQLRSALNALTSGSNRSRVKPASV